MVLQESLLLRQQAEVGGAADTTQEETAQRDSYDIFLTQETPEKTSHETTRLTCSYWLSCDSPRWRPEEGKGSCVYSLVQNNQQTRLELIM